MIILLQVVNIAMVPDPFRHQLLQDLKVVQLSQCRALIANNS